MLPAVFDHLWQSTLFAGVAALVTLALGEESGAGSALGVVRGFVEISDTGFFVYRAG